MVVSALLETMELMELIQHERRFSPLKPFIPYNENSERPGYAKDK